MFRKLLYLPLFVFSFSVFGQTTLTRIVPSESVNLRDPSAISMAPDGSIVISDTGHNRVLSVDHQGKLIFEIGSMGSGNGEFLWPKDVAAESGIVIWVADYGNRRVCKLSRQFEFQGCLNISDDASSTPEQVEKIAASPQGDVFLYAEDSGQLLRYDPLFTLQGSLGSILGQNFIPKIRQLAYLPEQGVVWHSRGDKFLSCSDPLLTYANPVSIGLSTLDEFVFASSGTRLIAAGIHGIYQVSLEGDPAVELISESQIKDAGIKKIDDIVVTKDDAVYILESRSGSVYHVNLLSR